MREVTLTAPEVMLREFRRRDADAVHRWVGDHRAVEYVPLGPYDRAGTVGYVRSMISERRARPRTNYTLAIVEPGVDDEPVGAVALSVDSAEHRRGELGFMVRRDRWGRGIARAAAGRLMQFGFDDLGLHRIWAVCDPDNRPSARVLEGIGMRFEGRLRGDMLIRGRRADSLLYARCGDDEGAYL